MNSYLLSAASTITHSSYDFDHLGNRVQSGAEALIAANLPLPASPGLDECLCAFELALALTGLEAGWVDLHESVGSSKLMVMINLRTLQTFTFHNGDFSLVSCSDALAFSKRVAYERKFYKIRAEDYTLIHEGDAPKIYDHHQKMFLECGVAS